MLKLRVFSAIILALSFLGILWLPNRLFAVILGVVVLLAAWEWFGLWSKINQNVRIIYRWPYVLVIAGLLFFLYPADVRPILGFALFWWIIAILTIWLYPRGRSLWKNNSFYFGVAGAATLVPAWRALVEMQAEDNGPLFVLLFMSLIWIADISAYFGGKRWGKKKLAPLISPGKSWEGVFTAIFCNIILTLIFLLGYDIYQNFIPGILLLSLVTVIVSIHGDLFESLVKREAGVKDSSQMIPGHGGVLDRIDSINAAAPIFLIGTIWLL